MKQSIKNILKKNKIILNLYVFFVKKRRNYFFKRNSQLVFVQFDKAMKEAKCEYWLTFGTLLGCVRDNSIIKHDLDLDVGVFFEDYTVNLVNTLKKYGFKRSRFIKADDGEGYEETYEYNNVSIDIFYFYKKGNNVYCHDFIPKLPLSGRDTVEKYGGLILRKIELPFEGLIKKNFLSVNVNIPRNWDLYLSSHYGNDYLIPNPNWSTLNSPAATVLFPKIGIITYN